MFKTSVLIPEKEKLYSLFFSLNLVVEN